MEKKRCSLCGAQLWKLDIQELNITYWLDSGASPYCNPENPNRTKHVVVEWYESDEDE